MDFSFVLNWIDGDNDNRKRAVRDNFITHGERQNWIRRMKEQIQAFGMRRYNETNKAGTQRDRENN